MKFCGIALKQIFITDKLHKFDYFPIPILHIITEYTSLHPFFDRIDQLLTQNRTENPQTVDMCCIALEPRYTQKNDRIWLKGRHIHLCNILRKLKSEQLS